MRPFPLGQGDFTDQGYCRNGEDHNTIRYCTTHRGEGMSGPKRLGCLQWKQCLFEVLMQLSLLPPTAGMWPYVYCVVSSSFFTLILPRKRVTAEAVAQRLPLQRADCISQWCLRISNHQLLSHCKSRGLTPSVPILYRLLSVQRIKSS